MYMLIISVQKCLVDHRNILSEFMDIRSNYMCMSDYINEDLHKSAEDLQLVWHISDIFSLVLRSL
jgi:hypothetical protein